MSFEVVESTQVRGLAAGKRGMARVDQGFGTVTEDFQGDSRAKYGIGFRYRIRIRRRRELPAKLLRDEACEDKNEKPAPRDEPAF
jgi:hypothetical protein